MSYAMPGFSAEQTASLQATIDDAVNKALATFEAQFGLAQHQIAASQHAHLAEIPTLQPAAEQFPPSLDTTEQPQSNLHTRLHSNETAVSCWNGEELGAFDLGYSFHIASGNASILASPPGYTRDAEDMEATGQG